MKTNKLVMIAIFSAFSFVIMIFSLKVPFFPFFLEIDFSEVPALFVALIYGPLAGIAVVLIKNLMHLFISSNMGIGELANFLVGASFIGVFAYLFKKKDYTFQSSSIISILTMAFISVIANLIIVIPLYEKFLSLPLENIIEIAKAVNPYVNNLLSYLVLTIVPFNVLKGSLILLVSYLIFSRLNNINNINRFWQI